MPLVELVGPPAIGKSTLVDACVGRGASDARRELLQPRLERLTSLAELARSIPRSKRFRRLLADRLLLPPALHEVEAALADVAPAWNDFLTLILGGADPSGPSSPVSPALALMERSWLLEAVQVRALLAVQPASSRLLVLDEGLSHPYKVLAAAGERREDQDRYAGCFPIPDVLAVLDAPTEVVVERLTRRARSGPPRARWVTPDGPFDGRRIEDEVHRTRGVVARIVEGAQARGCTIVHVDAEGSVTDAADALLHQIEIRQGAAA